MDEGVLRRTVADLVAPSRGILAADESTGTIKRRFDSIGAESTQENRRAYRSLLLTTPGIGEYICGVILFEETLGQADGEGTPLPEVAAAAGVVPGIKVDKGTTALAGAPGDLITEGLDGLAGRLEGYKEQGARFAKWREVYNVSDTLPSALAISANAEVLARYARICQEAGVVPIVEPEVLMDGGHTIERCAEVTEAALRAVFAALDRHGVLLEGHRAEAEHGPARQRERPQGLARGGRRRDPDRLPACGTGGGTDDQLPFRGPASGGIDGEPERDQRGRGREALGAELLLRTRPAGAGAGGVGRQGRERVRRAGCVVRAGEAERPRARRSLRGRGRGLGGELAGAPIIRPVVGRTTGGSR